MLCAPGEVRQQGKMLRVKIHMGTDNEPILLDYSRATRVPTSTARRKVSVVVCATRPGTPGIVNCGNL
jgi:hypothetical protein